MLILVVKKRKKKKLEKTCSAGYVTLGLLAAFSFEANLMLSNGLYPGILSVVLSITRYFMDCYFSCALALAPLLQLL